MKGSPDMDNLELREPSKEKMKGLLGTADSVRAVESSSRSLTSLVVGDAAPKAIQPRKAPKRALMEEEEYLDTMESIIQRDFYPDLPKLQAQAEYLAAVEANDVARIRQLQLKYSSRRTELRANSPTLRRSPSTFETPTPLPTRNPDIPDGSSDIASLAGDSDQKKEAVMDPKQMSLGQFLTKYNSEDNAAFNDLQRLDEKRHQLKHGWMYRAEIKHNRDKVTIGPNSNGAQPADVQAALDYERPRELDNWSYKARNAVLFVHEELPLSAEEAIEAAKKKPPEISTAATRFKVPAFSESTKKERMTKAGILQTMANRGRVDAHGQEEPGLHSALDRLVTPSPMPGAPGDSPMMTWGEIDGTPFRLDASDTPLLANGASGGRGFKIPDLPMRDQLAHSLHSEIAARHRAKKAKAVEETKSIGLGSLKRTPTPRQRLASMSPAARRLASNKLGIRLGTESTLPSPSPRRSANSTPTALTPRGSIATAKASPRPPDRSSITDGLLNLPSTTTSNTNKRQGAADFF